MTVPDLFEVPPALRLGHLSASKRRTVNSFTAPGAAVVILTVLGALLRLLVAHQSLFADELSTYWIVADHGLGGVWSLLNGTYPGITHAEISPPLFFFASWLTSQLSHSPELVRLPSLIAGVLTIPVMYRLGLKTVGRGAAILGAAFITLSPFMIYYSTEARSYAVMMLLATLSTLAMLRAMQGDGVRWWVAYALFSCAAVYTHYTCAFYLIAQFLWLTWTHREALRPAVLANGGAILGLVPWAHGLMNDLNSPTEKILSALSPFTPGAIEHSVAHWAIGFPYVEAGSLRVLPGTLALGLFGLAVIVCAVGLGQNAARSRGASVALDERLALIVVLALSVPVGEALVSALSTHLFGVRNLAASWPPLALLCAAAATRAGPRLRFVAATLAVVAFAIGAGKMLTVHFSRPAFRDMADLIDQGSATARVVIDGTAVLSPGPLSGLDVAAVDRRVELVRAFAPVEHGHPFGIYDPVATPAEAVATALAAAHGGRIVVVAFPNDESELRHLLQARYRLVESRLYPEFIALRLDVWAARGTAGA